MITLIFPRRRLLATDAGLKIVIAVVIKAASSGCHVYFKNNGGTMSEHDLVEMKLHNSKTMDIGLTQISCAVTRVVDGWLYTILTETFDGDVIPTTTFVPERK